MCVCVYIYRLSPRCDRFSSFFLHTQTNPTDRLKGGMCA